MTMKAKKLIFIKCCWGCSTDSKFIISETLAHIGEPLAENLCLEVGPPDIAIEKN